MNINTYILAASKKLSPFATDLQHIAENTIKKVSKLIPVQDVDIMCYDNSLETIETIGIGGYTPNQYLIYIALDSQRSTFADDIKNHLGRQIAHELHHTLRWKNPGYGQTLFEALVTEGLADHFSYEVYPGKLEAWDTAFSQGKLENLLKLAEVEYDNPKYDHSEWFFGSNPLRIPRWAGYSLGYEIIKQYLRKHPSQKASKLYASSASIFRS